MLKVINVVGARPNFMKVAPVMDAMRARPQEFAPVLVHTGQHYDAEMSDSFFRDLAIPRPDEYLEVGSGTHAEQTALVMQRFEPIVIKHKPDWVLVFGDVNSTIACALVCAKLLVPVAHVEAGLRSYDRRMPEEINRVLTDQISDLLLTPSPDAEANLLREGVAAGRIKFVGNIMIDSLFRQLERSLESDVRERFRVEGKNYACVTLHRPSNVDDRETLARVVDALAQIARRIEIVFPVHPRTRAALERFGLSARLMEAENITLTEPLGYLDFLRLYSGARIVLTDSGGIQEETTALGIPCLTLRENTERPVTVELGTNAVVGTSAERIMNAAFKLLDQMSVSGEAAATTMRRAPRVPLFWDGRTAERILERLLEASRNRASSTSGDSSHAQNEAVTRNEPATHSQAVTQNQSIVKDEPAAARPSSAR